MRYYDRTAYLRRRERQEGGLKLVVVIRTFLMLVAGVCIALFYVWQNVQLVRMGYHIKEKEKAVMELTKRSKALEIDLSMLKMPIRILQKIREENMKLDIPDMWNVVKLRSEPILYEEDLLDTQWRSHVEGQGLIDISKRSLKD